MEMTNPFTLVDILTKTIPGTVVSRWASGSDHEEIVLRDSYNNLYEIKFYSGENKGDEV